MFLPRVLLFLLCALALAARGSAALSVHAPAHLSRRAFGARAADFGATALSGRAARGPVAAAPPDALCGGPARPEWSGAVLMTTGGKCPGIDKVMRAQGSGAVGVLITRSDLRVDGSNRKRDDVKIAVETIDDKDYEAIKAVIDENIVVDASLGYSLNVLRAASVMNSDSRSIQVLIEHLNSQVEKLTAEKMHMETMLGRMEEDEERLVEIRNKLLHEENESHSQ